MLHPYDSSKRIPKVFGQNACGTNVKNVFLTTRIHRFRFVTLLAQIREASRAAAVHWLTVGGISSWLNALLTSQILTGSGDEREPLVGILAGLDDDSLRDSLLSQTETQTSFKVKFQFCKRLKQCLQSFSF